MAVERAPNCTIGMPSYAMSGDQWPDCGGAHLDTPPSSSPPIKGCILRPLSTVRAGFLKTIKNIQTSLLSNETFFCNIFYLRLVVLKAFLKHHLHTHFFTRTLLFFSLSLSFSFLDSSQLLSQNISNNKYVFPYEVHLNTDFRNIDLIEGSISSRSKSFSLTSHEKLFPSKSALTLQSLPVKIDSSS